MPFPALDPVVSQTPSGWLAVSPDTKHPRIGVIADSADAAKSVFRATLGRWSELRDAAEEPALRVVI